MDEHPSVPTKDHVTGTVIEFHKSDPFLQEEQSDTGDEQETTQSAIHKCQSGTPQND